MTSAHVSATLCRSAVVAFAVGGALLAAASTGCGRATQPTAAAEHASNEPAPVPVTVEKVTLRPVQRVVYTTATIHGLEEVIVTPEVEGIVRRLHYEVGDRVKPGDVLVELDATNYRLAVDEAQKALLLELAKLGLTELPAKGFDTSQVPSVVRAQRLLDNARRQLARIEDLRGRNVKSQEEYDEAQTQYQVAAATLEQTIDEVGATLAAARLRAATLATAEERLADATVRVPEAPTLAPEGFTLGDYVVAERMVSEGEMVRAFPSKDMFRLVVDNPLKVRARVSERNIGVVREGQTLKLKVEAYPDELFDGQIVRVYPTVDRASRTFEVEALVPNDDHRLKPGVFAKGGILTQLDPEARTVPPEAVVTFAGVTKVFLVRDGAAYGVEVATGDSADDWIEVRGELDGDSLVVTSGQSKLADATPVRVREGAAPEMARRAP